MFDTYEDARNYLATRNTSYKPFGPCYIMTKDGRFNVAYCLEEKEYAESLGYTLATK